MSVGRLLVGLTMRLNILSSASNHWLFITSLRRPTWSSAGVKNVARPTSSHAAGRCRVSDIHFSRKVLYETAQRANAIDGGRPRRPRADNGSLVRRAVAGPTVARPRSVIAICRPAARTSGPPRRPASNQVRRRTGLTRNR